MGWWYRPIILTWSKFKSVFSHFHNVLVHFSSSNLLPLGKNELSWILKSKLYFFMVLSHSQGWRTVCICYNIISWKEWVLKCFVQGNLKSFEISPQLNTTLVLIKSLNWTSKPRLTLNCIHLHNLCCVCFSHWLKAILYFHHSTHLLQLPIYSQNYSSCFTVSCLKILKKCQKRNNLCFIYSSACN